MRIIFCRLFRRNRKARARRTSVNLAISRNAALFAPFIVYLSVILLVACSANSANFPINEGSESANVPPLSAPSNFSIVPTNGGASLTWDSVEGATGYKIYRSTADTAGHVVFEIDSPANTTSDSYNDTSLVNGISYTYTISAINETGQSSSSDTADEVMPLADSDGDGLIDIHNLNALDNIRRNLLATSYMTDEDDQGDDSGCPESGCFGYELTRDLYFGNPSSYEDNTVNTEWLPNASETNPGWQPIGGCFGQYDDDHRYSCATDGTAFGGVVAGNESPTFEGNGFIIDGLYIRANGEVGLFGATGKYSVIRNLGITNARVYGSDNGNNFVGALVGLHNGTISHSHASGLFAGGSGDNDEIGGLAGRSANFSKILSSYAEGAAHGGSGNNDSVGGLVGAIRSYGGIYTSNAAVSVTGGDGDNDYAGGLAGHSLNGRIFDSYATGEVTGGNGDSDSAGGLIGGNLTIPPHTSFIRTSYATGNVHGGNGNNDMAGGLIGHNGGYVTAVYATGDIYGGDSSGGDRGDDIVGGLIGKHTGLVGASYSLGNGYGEGGSDSVGELIGLITVTDFGAEGSVYDSYGFGDIAEEETRGFSSTAPISGGAESLTADNAGEFWNIETAPRVTKNVWDFGDSSQTPALRYSRYPDHTRKATCDHLPKTLLDGTPIICDQTLLPGQRRLIVIIEKATYYLHNNRHRIARGYFD